MQSKTDEDDDPDWTPGLDREKRPPPRIMFSWEQRRPSKRRSRWTPGMIQDLLECYETSQPLLRGYTTRLKHMWESKGYSSAEFTLQNLRDEIAHLMNSGVISRPSPHPQISPSTTAPPPPAAAPGPPVPPTVPAGGPLPAMPGMPPIPAVPVTSAPRQDGARAEEIAAAAAVEMLRKPPQQRRTFSQPLYAEIGADGQPVRKRGRPRKYMFTESGTVMIQRPRSAAMSSPVYMPASLLSSSAAMSSFTPAALSLASPPATPSSIHASLSMSDVTGSALPHTSMSGGAMAPHLMDSSLPASTYFHTGTMADDSAFATLPGLLPPTISSSSISSSAYMASTLSGTMMSYSQPPLRVEEHSDNCPYHDEFGLCFAANYRAQSTAPPSRKLKHSTSARDLIVFRTAHTSSTLAKHGRPEVELPSQVKQEIATGTGREKRADRTMRMKKLADLSAKHGNLVLFEYLEEHPPLLMGVGMASRLCCYHRRKSGVQLTTEDGDGEAVVLEDWEDSPFEGDVVAGRPVLGVECNLSRTPLLKSTDNDTDFLLVRSAKKDSKWYLRSIQSIYAASKQAVLMAVPAPSSKLAAKCVKGRIQLFIYRHLLTGPTIRIADVRESFPSASENCIRKLLKNVADFQRGDNTWRARPDVILPDKKELCSMMPPEVECCVQSMLAGTQVLVDMGLGSFLGSTREEGGNACNTAMPPAASQAQAQQQQQQSSQLLEHLSEDARYALAHTPWALTARRPLPPLPSKPRAVGAIRKNSQAHLYNCHQQASVVQNASSSEYFPFTTPTPLSVATAPISLSSLSPPPTYMGSAEHTGGNKVAVAEEEREQEKGTYGGRTTPRLKLRIGGRLTSEIEEETALLENKSLWTSNTSEQKGRVIVRIGKCRPSQQP